MPLVVIVFSIISSSKYLISVDEQYKASVNLIIYKYISYYAQKFKEILKILILL